MIKLGLKSPPDLEQRRGIGGTRNNPEILNPFKPVEIVMAADECRFFRVRVPRGWYLKYLVTGVNRRDGKSGYMKAEMIAEGQGWAELSPYPREKHFYLREGSNQAVVAIANQSVDRDILLKICQEGSPMGVILQPETSRIVEKFLVPTPAFQDPVE